MTYGRRSDSGTSLIAFAAGALVTFVAARLAPPLFGRAKGALLAAVGSDPFDALARDHRAVLALIDHLIETPDSARARRMTLLFQVKRMLTAHALAEEDIIYPMLHEDAQRPEKAIHLYREHAEIKLRLFELEHLDKDAPDWTAKLRELRQLIAQHAKEEEESEFPKLRAALGRQETAQLSSDVQREKGMLL